MKKSEEGFTNPLSSPAYFPPPYPFRNADTVMIEFETSKDAVEAELPEPLEYVPGSAIVIIQDAQIASGAPFHEGYIIVRTKYNGQPGWFAPYVFGCPEEAVLANRELYGWPEIMLDYPHPKMQKDGHTVTATCMRRGEVLMSVSTTLERRAKIEDLPNMDDIFTLKKIPSPAKDGKALRQLNYIRIEDVQVPELWAGRGSYQVAKSSQFHLEHFEPKRILAAYYFVMSWILPHAKAVWDV